MRPLCYSVAMSLDGWIAGPQGEYDWIPEDSEIDFPALFSRFDTAVMGRKSWEIVKAHGIEVLHGMRTVVASRTLDPATEPNAIVTSDAVSTVRELKRDTAHTKAIWLFGGGELFRHLLDANLVDEVETAIVPILLNHGIPFLPPSANAPQTRLIFTNSTHYPTSGIHLLRYRIPHPQLSPPKPHPDSQ